MYRDNAANDGRIKKGKALRDRLAIHQPEHHVRKKNRTPTKSRDALSRSATQTITAQPRSVGDHQTRSLANLLVATERPAMVPSGTTEIRMPAHLWTNVLEFAGIDHKIIIDYKHDRAEWQQDWNLCHQLKTARLIDNIHVQFRTCGACKKRSYQWILPSLKWSISATLALATTQRALLHDMNKLQHLETRDYIPDFADNNKDYDFLYNVDKHQLQLTLTRHEFRKLKWKHILFQTAPDSPLHTIAGFKTHTDLRLGDLQRWGI